MPDEKFDLRNCCHVNTNEDGDRFVGVKVDQNSAVVYFPLGYDLPEDDRLLRRDIRTLFSILAAFGSKEDRVLKGNKFVEAHPVDFPIIAYLDVLDYFMENNGRYYTETEKLYKTDTKGKIDWRRTTKRQNALIKDGQPIYTKFDVEYKSPLDKALITKIHQYCVYESYTRLGWLYTTQRLPKPELSLEEGNKRIFIQELQKKYNHTNKDRDKRLFKSMKVMIEFIDDRVLNKQFYFGTDSFETIWEKLIDKMFGIQNKEDYFPRAVWIERHGHNKGIETHALMPDTIMIYNDKIYILDAKYYRYGDTHNPANLPESTSINKQITYGEYIKKIFKPDNNSLFNAFIMPYNMNKNLFDTNAKIVNVSESYGKRRNNLEKYEKIQGILIDIRYIIHNYIGNHDKDKALLVEEIEKYL